MLQNSNILYLNFLRKSGISSFLQNEPNILYKIEIKEKRNSVINEIEEASTLKDLTFLFKKLNNLNHNKYFDNFVFGVGNENSKILIVSDYPESKKQKNSLFEQQSEVLLHKMLKSINLFKDNIFTTHIIPYSIKENFKIENEEILKCLPYIQRQIELIKPNIILLMGSVSAKGILGTNLDINKLRNRWHKYKSINMSDSIKCLVTYHPRHLIKFPEDKKNAWDDLKKFNEGILNDNQ